MKFTCKVVALLATMLGALSVSASAQSAGVKTNLLSDALLNPNIGVELGLAPKWTLDVSGQINA